MSEKPDPDMVAKLREALLALVDEQNGPPLIRRKERWLEAMANAHEALGQHYAVDCYRAQLRGRWEES